MLMWPSAVANTPVGMLVGWLLPACCGTSPSTSQRAAWKSSMKIWACEQRGLDPLALARGLALEQREQDALRGEQAGAEVGDRDADPHRPLAGQAGDRHQPAHALRDLVEARALGVGAVLAEAGDAGETMRGLTALSCVVVDAEPVLDVGAVVLDHDVGALDQPEEDLAAFRRP